MSATPATGSGTEKGPLETWSGIQALGWIATRSRDFVGGLRVAFVEDAEGALAMFRLERSPPYPKSIAESFETMLEEAERGTLRPQNSDWRRRADGTLLILNIHEFHSVGMLFSSAAVTDVWPEYAEARAWELAKSMPRQRPERSAASWGKRLPAQEALGLAVVINAVTPNSNSLSTNPRKERAAQLSFCIGLLQAVAEGHVKLMGVPCERPYKDRPDELRRPTDERIVIEPEVAAMLSPVLNGRSDWLGKSEYANNFALDGNAVHSVCFCDVIIERKSLLRWLSQPLRKRLTEAEVIEILQRQPAGTAIDKAVHAVQAVDPGWKRDPIRRIAQAMNFEGKRGRPRKKSAGKIAPED